MSDNPNSYVLLGTEPDVQCLVCTRPFTLDPEVNDSFEALAICRECKMTVLNDQNRDGITGSYQERRRRRPRSRATRFESVEAAFSQRLSHLINLAGQGHETDIDSPPVSRQHVSYTSTPNRSQRWHGSDDESDGLNYVDSVFGETESNLSVGDYGGESDASLDQHVRIGREIIIQLDSGSYMDTDTDVDPMNAAVDQWETDDQEDDVDEQSEESEYDDVVEIMEGPGIRTRFIGNPGDYVDARGFEMLLEQLAEDNNARRGAPPAAESIVENLPSVVISSTNHETNGGVTCPVCKDNMPAGTVARRLPCMHLYHSSCILPWLSYRNTCPVCRYELRTDDLEYEKSKQDTMNERIHGVEHIHPHEPVEEISDEPEVEGAFNTQGGTAEEANMNGHSVQAPQHPIRAWGHHRWLVSAAAPVVSLVGLALVLCFANSSCNARRQLWRRS